MKVHRGLEPPPVKGARYNFDELQHGDAIEVESLSGAREMFRRWRRKTGRVHTRLMRAREQGQEKLLFFLDLTPKPPKRRAPAAFLNDEV